LDAELAAPVDPDGLRERVTRALRDAPALGPPPTVMTDAGWDTPELAVRALAEPAFESDGPLVRIGLVPGYPAHLVLAGHHVGVDGLGLLELLAAAVGDPLQSGARGLGAERPPHRGFVTTAATRVAQALLAPATRVAPSRRDDQSVGERFRRRDLAGESVTARLTAGVVAGVRAWNRSMGARSDRVVVNVGVSLRSGGEVRIEDASSYLRLRLPSWSPKDVGHALRTTPREPDAPRGLGASAAAAGARPIGRLLSGRMGATLLVSHLGSISGPDRVRSIAFYPVAHGRSGVAVGASTMLGRTTVTLRCRRRDFDGEAADRLIDALVAGIRGAAT
jgi:hypothetical protein